MASISTYCHHHKHGLAQMYNFGAELTFEVELCVLLLLLTFICSTHSSQEKPMKILTTLHALMLMCRNSP